LWTVVTRRLIEKFASRYDECMSKSVWKNTGISPWIPWSRSPLCKVQSSWAIQENPGVYETWVHHRVHKSPTPFSILDRVSSIHNDPIHFLKIYFKTPLLHLGLPIGLFLLTFLTRTLYTSLISTYVPQSILFFNYFEKNDRNKINN